MMRKQLILASASPRRKELMQDSGPVSYTHLTLPTKA